MEEASLKMILQTVNTFKDILAQDRDSKTFPTRTEDKNTHTQMNKQITTCANAPRFSEPVVTFGESPRVNPSEAKTKTNLYKLRPSENGRKVWPHCGWHHIREEGRAVRRL